MNTTVFLKERQTSEQRYNRLLACVTDYAYTVRVEGGRAVGTSHGAGCEAVTGYSSQELEGNANLWLQMIYPQDRGAVLVQAERILKGEAPPPLEHRIVRKDGNLRWIRNTAVPRRDSRGVLVAYDGFVSDITDRKAAEEELGRAEARYHELLENLTVGVCRNTAGERGRFLEVNAAMVAMVEAGSKAELMQHAVSDFYVDPVRRKEFSEKLAIIGFLKDVEVELISLKGRRFWASINARATTGPGGVVLFDSVIEDITERKRAEELLRAERILMRTVLDNLPDVIYVKDLAGRKTLTNRAELQLMGDHTQLESSGNTDFLFYSREASTALSADDQQVVSRGEAVMDREELVLDEQGKPHWLVSSKLPLRDETGGIIGVVGIGRDITERKLAQQALRESEERLALVIQGSNDGIWDWNLITDQVYFSTRWKSMLGYEEQEIGDHVSAWENLIHPEDRERAIVKIQSYLAGQSPTYELEHRLRHKDGTYRWVLARGVAQRGTHGQPVRLVGSHIDLTERKLAIEQLRRAYSELARNEEVLQATMLELKASNEQLKTAQLQLIQAAKLESIGTLAAGVAHEVKNPLQTILMGLEFLDRNLGKAPENINLVKQDMRDAVTRANLIISELLQLSAARDFDMRCHDVNELVERALLLVNNEVVASKTRVSLSLAPGLAPVRMDRSKMEQVLINLFMNALQAMSQEGVLSVRTRAAAAGERISGVEWFAPRVQPGESLVVVEVQDTGQGIPPEHMSRIFDPFFTTKAVGVGTGLGLSVVRQIVDLHGGAIALNNVPEGGVLVTLVLKTDSHGHTADKQQRTTGGTIDATQEKTYSDRGRRAEYHPAA